MELKTKFNIGDRVNTQDGEGVVKAILLKSDGNYYFICCEKITKYYKEPEISKTILTEKEKNYLNNVIKPFRDKVVRIAKYDFSEHEYIYIEVKSIIEDETETFALPFFEKGTLYRGMEKYKDYTLKELGL